MKWGGLISGALLGRVGHEGLIPPAWVASAVGGNYIMGTKKMVVFVSLVVVLSTIAGMLYGAFYG